MSMSENKNHKILLVDKEGQELASYPFSKREEAFAYAEKLEDMGIEVHLKEPSLPESLILSLGAGPKETDQLKEEIDQEINDHGPNCCNTSQQSNLH